MLRYVHREAALNDLHRAIRDELQRLALPFSEAQASSIDNQLATLVSQ